MAQQVLDRRTFGLAALMGAGSLLAGCAGTADGAVPAGSDEAGNGEGGGSLTWGWRLPSTWDAARGIGYDVHVLSLVYCGLTRLDPDGELVPDAAESWAYADDGRAVTFRLRSGLVFSDGAPLDAEAVRTSLLRSRDLPGATSAQSLAVVEDIVADSDHELTLRLSEVSHQVPLLLSGLVGHLVSPKALESGASIDSTPVGAGPFLLAEHVPGSHVLLHRNPDHWNAQEILLDQLRIVPPPAESLAYAGLSSGQYDIAHVEPSQLDALAGEGFTVSGGPCFNVWTIEINNRRAPWDDARVVEAFNRAIDRQGLVEGPLFGRGDPAWQPFSRDVQGYDPGVHAHWDHDPDRARELLAEAGHAAGVRARMHIAGDAGNEVLQKFAEVVQAQARASGFELDLVVAPPGSGQKAAHTYDLYVYSFSGRESPVQALEVLYSPEGWMNISQQATDGFVAALERARRTPLDSRDYRPNLRAAVREAVSGASPHAWLVNWDRSHAMNDRVTGFTHCIHTQRFEGVGVRR